MTVRLVLVGLPGSGKSTVGAAVARLLAVPFEDSDALVQEMTGRSAGQIIEDDGEQAFRDIEATAILDALLDFDGVLALGGGAVTTEAVREELKATHIPTVLLAASQEELVRRIGSTQHRPLLAGDTGARLLELAQQRDAFYREVASVVVDTTALSVAQAAETIVREVAAL